MNQDLLALHEETAAVVVRPFFPKMVAISLVLHTIFAIIIASGGAGRPGDATINYLDLTMSEPTTASSKPVALPAEMSPPAEEAADNPEEQTPQIPTEAEKLQQEAQNALQSASSQPEAMQKLSIGLGLLNGNFSTIADGRTLRDDMREDHLSLLRALNENWWRNGNKFEGRSSSIVNIIVSRSGEIINVQILQSSGNPSYDRIMAKSLLNAGPLPPLPSFYEPPVFIAPIRFSPPLTLFGSSAG